MADITANRYLILGTAAQRVAFVPDPVDLAVSGPGEFMLPLWLESDTGDLYAWDNVTTVDWVQITSGGAGGITQLTGDVTAGPGSGSQVATIANDAVTTLKILDANVTLAKIADIPTNSLIGRDTAATGVPENILLTAPLQMDGAGNLELADTAVTPAAYKNANITVDQQGRLTAAADGVNGAIFELSFGDSGGFNPADSTTYLIGYQAGFDPLTTDDLPYTMPKAGIIKAVYGRIRISGTLGTAGQNSTFSVRNITAGTSEVISSTVSLSANPTRFNNAAMTLAFAAGDELDISWLTPAWTTNPTVTLGSFIIYVELTL